MIKTVNTKLVVAAVLVLGVVAFFTLFDVKSLLESLLETISSLGFWGLFVYAILYIVACVFFLPGSILTLGAGFLFGVVKGSVLVSIASTLGATAAFLVGRYFARDWVASKIKENKKFNAIDYAVKKEGWKIVGLIRLSPVFPFSLLNYGLGLTSVSLRDYFFASWIGMMPGTVMYVYFGSLAGSLAELSVGSSEKSPAEWALYGVGLIATIAVTVYVTKIAKKAIAEQLEES